MNGDAVSVLVGVLSLVVAVALVVVTWRYAASTDRIARDTARAAESAELAARVTLAQGVWAIQPTLSVRAWAPTMPRETRGGGVERPLIAHLTVRNTGLGTAEGLLIYLSIGGEEYAPAERLPHMLEPGRELEIRFLPPKGVAGHMPVEDVGLSLRISYFDSLGSRIVDTYSDPGSIEEAPQRIKRTYDGGEAIDDRIRQLLAEIERRRRSP